MIPVDVLDDVGRDLHDRLLRHSPAHRSEALPWCAAGQTDRCAHGDCCARPRENNSFCEQCVDHC